VTVELGAEPAPAGATGKHHRRRGPAGPQPAGDEEPGGIGGCHVNDYEVGVEGDRGCDRRIAGPDVGDVDALGAKQSPQGRLGDLVIVDDQDPRRLAPAAGDVGQLARARSGDDLYQLHLRHDGPTQGVQYAYRGAYLNALNEVIVADVGTDSVYLWTLPMFHCNGWCFPWAVIVVAVRHVTMRGGSRARMGAHRRRGRDALPAL
jgi:hypothetical protein